MKQTKNLIIGVLSCLLLAVGLAHSNDGRDAKNNSLAPSKTSVTEVARAPLGTPGDDGPSVNASLHIV
jgi:hypothetical protein